MSIFHKYISFINKAEKKVNGFFHSKNANGFYNGTRWFDFWKLTS